MSRETSSDPIPWEELVAAAKAVREKAWAPYSRFRVGAALLADDGTIFAGCNVENRSYGLCVCAERNALTTAVAQGHRRFRACAVVVDDSPVALPCGMCRESLTEFDPQGEMEILAVNLDGEERRFRLGEIFPEPFVLPGDETTVA